MINTNKNIKYLLAVFLLITTSCVLDDDPEAEVDEALIPYFENFVEEAAIRGLTIDFNTDLMEGLIMDLSDRDIKGRCIHDNLLADQIIIDSAFWENADHFSREFIVFHELGHCYLDRNHTNDLDKNGICKSIMHSGTLSCRRNYDESTRSIYLDELFMN